MTASLNSAAPGPATVRIIIADAQPIFRDGLRRFLEAAPHLRIVAETGDRLALPQLVRDLRPDILLFGVMPARRSAGDTLREVARCHSGVRTMLLTAATHTAEVIDAVQAGASAVMSRDSALDVLFKGIESVMDGHYWVGNSTVSDVAASLRKFDVERRRAKAFGLTRRELEIVRAVVSGYTNRQIAKQFSISESTVKRHVTHIFDKLGASTRIEVALFAAHHRLLDGV